MTEKIELRPWLDELQAIAQGYELIYPDSLVDLYKHCNGLDRPWGDGAASERMSARVWAAISVKVYNKLCERATMAGRMAVEDLVQGFIKGLICPDMDDKAEKEACSCPDEIRNAGILINRANKYAMIKIDGCAYEINKVLHTALRELVKDGSLCRSEPEKTITAFTRFWLKGCCAVRVATPEECAKNCKELPKVGNADEKHQMLTCSEAKRLSIALIKSVGEGVAVTESELMACVKSRTRNVLSITYSEMSNEGCGADADGGTQKEYADIRNDVDREAASAMQNEAETMIDSEDGADDSGTMKGAAEDGSSHELSFQELQLQQLSSKLAREIFDGVSEMDDGVRIMALYTLPELYRKGNIKENDVDVKKTITAADFGDFRKVSATNKKIRDKIRDVFETKIGRLLRMHSDSCISGRDVAISALEKIFRLCAENGYSVTLK